ncbi:sigma-54-dependent Fis family transcriptional regulator [Nocardioides nitrophenolicus]|uniref:sigma-54-dependent Fis family transcriptional regulator n=1 Tax=Nocardioides nitrophenolicus TaxID=60489 RepID=UPI001957DCA8|nr:helix-turn-helix domain-containing protein [Nocardioides nitrophenolicus]MBM7516874.1 transcriptional regulator of acetoin/glycerol metabolism [Nocardioides nitrophenolicus]
MTTRAQDLRDPIAESWRRAELAGLTPGSALDHLTYGDVDHTTPLQIAASPVLDELNEQLEGTMFGTLLVDREGRIAQRWCGDTGARRAFDNLGVDVGASLLEEAVGTNALGTVLETRTSISVNGREHFAVALRRFSCYGHPIFHPTTRRIEGVLDITALMEEASPLLPPLVARAVADIEQRLLDGSRVSEKQLLAAFQAAASRRRAVVAIGNDLLMSNQAAADLLGSTDVALLRMLASDVRGEASIDLTLESGLEVRVEAARVGGARGGALLHVEPHREPKRPRPATDAPSTHAPLLVAGPPGSGRSAEARRLADPQPVAVLNAASALLDGTDAWARNFGALVRAGQGSVCIDGIDLLPDDLVDLVASHLAERRAPRLVLVSGPVDGLSGRAAALAGECTERRLLTPLASRPQEIPELVRAMLVDLGADPSLHFTPGALGALSSQPWPGNLRELRAVVEHVVRRRRTGAVVVDELPEAYRTQEPARPLAPIDRAERTVIVAALREHDGNKVKAAQALGISRTTLYAKMRALRITVY